MAKAKRGKFIVFEGLDGSGTSTQCGALRGWVAGKGIASEVTREPSDGPIGTLIRQGLSGRLKFDGGALALLFAADRLDHLHNATDGIEAMLKEGTWVLSERYVLSSLAYQATMGLPCEWVAEINKRALVPDATVFLDVPAEVCAQRIAARSGRDELFHKQEFLGKVAREYDRLLEGTAPVGRLIRLDGTGPREKVSARMLKEIAKWVGEKS